MANSDILLGTHGSGLSHLMHLPSWGEFPKYGLWVPLQPHLKPRFNVHRCCSGAVCPQARIGWIPQLPVHVLQSSADSGKVTHQVGAACAENTGWEATNQPRPDTEPDAMKTERRSTAAA